MNLCSNFQIFCHFFLDGNIWGKVESSSEFLSKSKIYFKLNEIEKIQKINQIDGKTYPEDKFTDKLKLLKGFNNRLNEKILSIEELFKQNKN